MLEASMDVNIGVDEPTGMSEPLEGVELIPL